MNTYFNAYDEVSKNAGNDEVTFGKERFPIGSIVTVRVIGIYDHFVEVGSQEDGHYIGSIHISKIRDTFIEKLEDWFYINQIVNVFVEGWDDAYGYEFRFNDVRQPNGLKINSYVQVKIVGSYDDARKYTCNFVDFEGSGIVIAPKNYTVHIGSLLPVRIIDFKKDLVITKL